MRYPSTRPCVESWQTSVEVAPKLVGPAGPSLANLGPHSAEAAHTRVDSGPNLAEVWPESIEVAPFPSQALPTSGSAGGTWTGKLGLLARIGACGTHPARTTLAPDFRPFPSDPPIDAVMNDKNDSDNNPDIDNTNYADNNYGVTIQWYDTLFI